MWPIPILLAYPARLKLTRLSTTQIDYKEGAASSLFFLARIQNRWIASPLAPNPLFLQKPENSRHFCSLYKLTSRLLKGKPV